MTEQKSKPKMKAVMPPPADEPVPATKAQINALQKLHEGIAEPHQQRAAIEWIINQASAAYSPSFRRGGEDGRRDTDFALGRAFVGQQIIGLLKINLINYGEDE